MSMSGKKFLKRKIKPFDPLEGKTTDDVMRELRGRAPGDPYPPPEKARRKK